MTKSNFKLVLFSIILLMGLIGVYSNHFHNGFHFDDSHTIQENVHIRNIKNIPNYFSDPRMFSADPDHYGMRPIVTTTLAIDYWLGKSLEPFFFHLDTFIWFIVLGIMLYFMYKNLLNQSNNQHHWNPYLALFATALFCFHKANAETINYVISRSDVLSTFFIVASFLTYISYPEKRKYYLYIIPAIIGVFAKETVLVLVIILFFYILLFEKEVSLTGILKQHNLTKAFQALGKVLPLLIVVALFQYYTLSKVKAIPGITNALLPYLLTQTYVWLRYVIAFFLPMNLSADTDWTVIQNPFDERIIVGIIFLAVLIYTIFRSSEKKETRIIAFGLIWFAASLLPTSLAPFAEVTNDHRMFFAFVGLAISAVSYLGILLKKYETTLQVRKSTPILLTLLAVVVLSLHSYGVYNRNKVWNNEESLWYDVTIKSPANGRGLMNYGLAQMSKGNYADASTYFNKALVYLPYYSTLQINLGVLNGAIGKHADAELHFKKALELAPNNWESYAFYARYLIANQRAQEARQIGEKAYQLNPYSSLVLNVLMATYASLQQWDKMEATALQMLKILPGDASAKQFLEAARKKESILTLNQPNPNNTAKPATKTAADYLNLSLEYYNQQQYQKCIDACQEALKLKPNYADAYSNMGAAYNQMKQWKKGIKACEKALKIDPKHQLAWGNLNWAKTELSKAGN